MPRALCAALPVAGLLVPLAAAPAVSLPARGDLTAAADLAGTGAAGGRSGGLARGDAASWKVPGSSPTPPPSPSPSPFLSPSSSPSGAASGRLPETGTAGALPLIGLAALGCVLAGLMVLVAKARRKH
ncbi:LPXTG cell wall anchor domain-containing protein [Kitasatospora sp. NPDC001540]|uniref:LPXTG cell wall anchor domain-containing protein n=1 Tax=Kitasatospora sp. NPDC001540 TaxID=3364014 RepID=UPI0036BE2A3A